MKRFTCFLFLIIVTQVDILAQTDPNMKLWYKQPASRWEEALPVGNGRLGAMVFGDPVNEIIQLNENTVYAGQPNRNDNPLAKAALPEVRKLIFEGKYSEAQEIVNERFITKTSHGMPYQTVGNLKLTFRGHAKYTNYYRDLDIEKAVTTSSYTVEGVNYKTEVFSSFPDQVTIVKISSDEPGSINFSATMDRASGGSITTEGDNELVLSAVTSDHETVTGAVKFEARTKIITKGGKVTANDQSLDITKANAVIIYISIGTNFNNYHDIGGDAGGRAKNYLKNALNKNYDNILKDHIQDYQKYFNRVSLDLGVTDATKKPTDVRLAEFGKGNDPQLVTLYFQFGRYLLISSSRPGGQPANLQGLWNDQLSPPWDSKYTVNINTEMNYWPSEVTNLSELNEPLIEMVRELSESGKKTARDMYGAKGWVLHHNTDVWRINGPVDGATWGMWPMGGAWLSQHLMYKYEYSGDKEYLKSVYPVLKEASKFYLDFLVKEPTHQWLVVCPSISPENTPAATGSSLSAGTTMDNQLVFDLLTKTAATADILNTDKPLIAQLNETLNRLPPMQVGKWGQLQEWMNDWDRQEDHHRHVSHLYGLFPSNQISPYHTPELFEAARTSLLARGDESTGWSMGWKVNLWARLLDGNHAYKLIQDQLSPAIQPDGKQHGGTYSNLFDAHPPFQIDGNFGCTAGIAEMLMQSHDGAIHILPALPDLWKAGSVSGLRARGGFKVDIKWSDSQPDEVIIQSSLGGNCRIRSYYPLTGEGLEEAEGNNPNPFYLLPETKTPIISEEAEMTGLDLTKIFEYDLKTTQDESYHLKLQ